MKFRRHKPLFIGLIFLVFAGMVYAGGGREDTVLAEADALIEERRYDEAVLLLSDFIRQNPEMIYEAQERISHIMQVREQFNILAGELLDVMQQEPENNDKILELSNRLLTLGSPSDLSTLDFLTQVRELATFNFNRNRLEEIFAAARLLLERQDFSGALAVYAGGMDIYQSEFFAADYGDEAEQVAADGIEAVNAGVAAFNGLEATVNEASLAIGKFRESDPSMETVWAAFASIAPEIERLAGIKTSLEHTGDEYDASLNLLQRQYPNLQDRSFLSFASRLLRGPVDANEGMLGAIARYWELHVPPAEETAAEFTRGSYAAALRAMDNREYAAALPLIATAEGYLEISKTILDYWAIFTESSGVLPVYFFDEPVIPRNTEDFLTYSSMEQTLEFFTRAADIGNRGNNLDVSPFLEWQLGVIAVSAAISREQENRGALRSLKADVATLENDIEAEITEYRGFADQYPEPLGYLAHAIEVVRALDASLADRDLQSFVRYFTILNGDLMQSVNARYEEFMEGSSLVNGIVQQIESEGEIIDYTYYYPEEGLAVLTEMNRLIPDNIAAVEELLTLYRIEPEEMLQSGEGGTLYAEAAGMLTRLRDFEQNALSLMAAATRQIELAANYWQQGDRLYQEAQAALGRSNFDLARNRLELSQSRYNESLAIKESESLRRLRDDRLISLGQEIIRLENEFVVREVRDYVTRARTAYYSGNFDEAEELLTRAQGRWRTTNSTEEPEITHWLTMTRNALSLSTGRIIPVTAPLYAEMSQLLSDARRNYDEGIRLINAGRRQDGLARFSDARGMTQKVELMFPLNREARLLDLRIEQFTDPTAFNAEFRQRLDTAVAGTKPGVRSVESFAELQNLAEINPQYPGIVQTIVQAEIDMGYRQPPPDTQDQTRSENLTREARPIIENQNSAMYEVALVWLNEALLLDPNNTQAAMLKDTLQIRQTGTGSIILDSVSYERYQRAVMEFQRGNRYTAWAIVLQLLTDPENQKSMQIQDLLRRIESSL